MLVGDSKPTHHPTHRAVDPGSSAWEQAVGRFVLAFGSIEHDAISGLAYCPTQSLRRTAPKMALAIRLEALDEVLEQMESDELRALRAVVAEIRQFVGHRNLIAHSPLLFSFYRGKGANNIEIRPEIVSTRDATKRLTLAQLQQLANDAKSLADSFSVATVEALRSVPPQYVDPD